MKKEIQSSRRSFLKNTATLSALAALPSIASKASENITFIPTKLAAAGKVNLACVGIGNRGAEIIEELDKTGLCNIVALCDVDLGAPHTQKILDKFPKARRFQDFRKMFDAMGKKIEAVCIGVPDHTHFPITMLAMNQGKHVYVEKPMARTFREVEVMMNAAKKYKVVTQMGNQGHSEANYFQFKAWTEAGIIKDVTKIVAHMNNPRRWHGWDTNIKSFPPAETVPSTLNWDIWLGVEPYENYQKDFVNGQWRCWYNFGLGALGDWGAHIIDTAHQFLNLGLPYEINPLKLTGHNPFFFPQSTTLQFKFAERNNMPPAEIFWYDGVDNLPPLPADYGSSEENKNIPPPSTGKVAPVKLNPGKIIYSKDLTFKGGSHGGTLSIIPLDKAKDMASKLPMVPQSTSNHFANFLKACMGQEKTRSPFEIAGPLSQVLSLGVIAQWMGVPIQFDTTAKRITNNPIADQLLVGAPPRKGWEQYFNM